MYRRDAPHTYNDINCEAKTLANELQIVVKVETLAKRNTSITEFCVKP